jgi:hypothetical protein
MRYADSLDSDALKAYARGLNARGGEAQISADMLRDVILSCAGMCGWCGRSVVGRDIEIDHIIPLMRGGAHRADNLAVSCPDCNRRKAGKHPGRFAAEIAAETGQVTALVARVLAHYGMDAPRQASLFGDRDDSAPGSARADDTDGDETPPPPYRWTR